MFGNRASAGVLVSTPHCRVIMIGAVVGYFKNLEQINFSAGRRKLAPGKVLESLLIFFKHHVGTHQVRKKLD